MRFVFGISLFIAWVAPAYAEDVEKLLHEGVELRRQGHDLEALDHFRRAYEVDRGARVLAQVALAEQAVGLWVHAHDHLRQALAAADDPWIARHQDVLLKALRVIADHLGEIDVQGPAGAELFIDDEPAGKLPLAGPRACLAGPVKIEVKRGLAAVVRTVRVVPGMRARESVFLPEPPVPTSTASVPAAVFAAPHAARDPSRGLRIAAWVALPAAVGSLAEGVIAHTFYLQSAARWNDDSRCLVAGKTRYQACGADYDSAQAAQVGLIVGYSLAAALTAASTVLLVAARQRPSRLRAPLVAGCTPVPALGVACSVSF